VSRRRGAKGKWPDFRRSPPLRVRIGEPEKGRTPARFAARPTPPGSFPCPSPPAFPHRRPPVAADLDGKKKSSLIKRNIRPILLNLLEFFHLYRREKARANGRVADACDWSSLVPRRFRSDGAAQTPKCECHSPFGRSDLGIGPRPGGERVGSAFADRPLSRATLRKQAQNTPVSGKVGRWAKERDGHATAPCVKRVGR
jgi:hypothetical protein